METIVRFFSLQDPNVRYVVLGMLLLSVSTAVIGTFSLLRKKALAGDAVSHAVLPGVCLSFLISGQKEIWSLMAGAFVSGLLSLWCVQYISKHSKLKEDASIGIVLSVFFGLGVVLLTFIQHQGNASQSGLDAFLFGKAAVLMPSDVWVMSIVAVVMLFMVYAFYKEFTLFSFDPGFAQSIGLPVQRLEYILTALMVMSIVMGIQTVGVVLMSAMLITPAAIARFWTNQLFRMLILSVVFSMIASVAGAYISFLAPNMPTGPWIVVVLSGMALLSFLVAPQRGIVWKWWQARILKRKTAEENVLKAMYQLGEKENSFQETYTLEDIFSRRAYATVYTSRILQRLHHQGYVIWEQGEAQLTAEGIRKGSLITRRHRLWETYLTQVVNIAPDHVHDDAESMEHLITEELEKKLLEQLKDPSLDPHQSEIPPIN
ncbi:MAG: metal ABC transporter permease [Cytophagaceae bacterium]|jgi:manganese/zinc/iron transport system permease protein|nr:metal ABC transporter permease [Cytophagaceae bacterium]